MDIVLFQDITTESALQQLEADGNKYQGLYVDMDNKDERKYIKDSAALISGLLKKLDRARIDKSRDYKNSVEKEAESIRLRLEAANQPFTLLIDEHKEKRAKILAEQKAKEEAAALLIQIEVDHEAAFIEDKARAFDKAEQERLQKERDDEIAANAVKQAQIDADKAVQDKLDEQECERKLAEAEKLQRENDIAHKSIINRTALDAMIMRGSITEDQGKQIIKAIVNGQIPNVSIQY